MSDGTNRIYDALKGTYGNDETQTDSDDVFATVVYESDNKTVDGAATDVYTQWALKAPFDMQLVEAVVCPGAALTANDTNNAVLTIGKADGAGGGSTALATLTTNTTSGNWVADVFKSFTLVPAAVRVNKGQIVTLKKTIGASGVAIPNAHYTLKFLRV